MPVTSKLTGAPVIWSRSRSTSPTETRSSAAAAEGKAAGITGRSPWAGAAGQRPATSVAWPTTAFIAAAWRSGVLPLPVPGGDAGEATGTSPSGSDHTASS